MFSSNRSTEEKGKFIQKKKTNACTSPHTITYYTIHILYSGFISQEKMFANFVDLLLCTKILFNIVYKVWLIRKCNPQN